MTLKDYYKGLGSYKLPFRDDVLSKTGVNQVTFYRWISGVVVPNKLTQDYISKKSGIAVGELFTTQKVEDDGQAVD